MILLRTLAAYARHAPEHAGKWRLTNWAVRLSPQLKHAQRSRTIRVREGFRLIVDGKSQTGRIAYATGEYEPRSTRIMQTLLRSGDTVIDVGANIGYFAIVAAQTIGPAGHVYAFEPVPAVRESLIANLKLNGIANVTIQSEALSAASGDTEFYLGPREDTGLGSLRALPNGTSIPVRRIRFDDWWARRSRVGLVKIDVEGAELQVLEGMTECLARDQPDIIVEVTDEYLRSLGASAERLIVFLGGLGYHIYGIMEAGPLIPIEHASDLSRCPSQFNALCTHKSIEDIRV
jgi:FkbM family methyltransferase